ncbi:MAG: PRC-barrel domain-containing protein [Pseudomonadota bacterium]
MFRTLMTTTALVTLLAAPAIAEMHADKGDTAMETSAEMNAEMTQAELTAGDLVGMPVMGQAGERVGEIDYVIGSAGDYEAVIGVGGFLGLGEYTVALPMDRFEMRDDVLILSQLNEEELRGMPQIDESELDALDGDTVLN